MKGFGATKIIFNKVSHLKAKNQNKKVPRTKLEIGWKCKSTGLSLFCLEYVDFPKFSFEKVFKTSCLS